MVKNVLVLGAGGHCKVTIDLLRQLGGYQVLGVLDDNAKLHGSCRAGFPVLGGTDCVGKADFADCAFVIGAATPGARRAMWERLSSVGRTPLTLVHPGAYVSRDASLGEGSMVAVNAVVNSGARIGKGSLINTSAIVEHDCVVGDFVHVAPGARMAGCVEIANGAFIGIGATIVEFVRIGENATVGAGAVVIRDIPKGSIAVGNPSRIIGKTAGAESLRETAANADIYDKPVLSPRISSGASRQTVVVITPEEVRGKPVPRAPQD